LSPWAMVWVRVPVVMAWPPRSGRVLAQPQRRTANGRKRISRVGLGRTRRDRPCFPSPLHSFRTVGFPQYGWKTAFAADEPSPHTGLLTLVPLSPGLTMSRGLVALCRAIPLQSRWCVGVCRPTGPWLGAVYHARTSKRYYGLMRRPDGLRPVYGLSRSVFALTGRPPGFPFFALTHALRPCRTPYPADCPSSLDGSSLGHTSLHHLLSGSAVSACPLTGFREVRLSRQQVSLNVTACTLAGAADQSPPTPLAPTGPPVYSRACPSQGLPQPRSAITTRPNHLLPRRDFHPLACQRTKAAPGANGGTRVFGRECCFIIPNLFFISLCMGPQTLWLLAQGGIF